MNTNCLILILIALVAAAAFLYGRSLRGTRSVSIVEPAPAGARLIRVAGMSETKVNACVADMERMYGQDGDLVKPRVSFDGDYAFLSFDTPIDWMMFCYWVNYLTYSDKGKIFETVGWYPMSVLKSQDEMSLQLAGRTLMLFIPSSDTEYDNVYLTTPEGKCFKQPFAGFARIVLADSVHRQYEPMPR